MHLAPFSFFCSYSLGIVNYSLLSVVPHFIVRLKSRFHFSFAEYSNPRNTSFGVLRVLNDDLVQPSRGFGEHPHRDAEICTYIVEGGLTHKVMGMGEKGKGGDMNTKQ